MGLAPGDPAWRARGIAFPRWPASGTARWRATTTRSPRGCSAAPSPWVTPSTARSCPDDLIVPSGRARAGARGPAPAGGGGGAARPGARRARGPACAPARWWCSGDVRRKRGQVVPAREAFVSALAAAASPGVDRLSGEALRQLGLLDYFDGRLRDAEERFRQAHALAAQVDDPRGAGWALQHLAWSATTRGDYALADRTPRAGRGRVLALEDSGGCRGSPARGVRAAAAGTARGGARAGASRCCRSARRSASAGASPPCSPSTRSRRRSSGGGDGRLGGRAGTAALRRRG
jgi:hypothetical protein